MLTAVPSLFTRYCVLHLILLFRQ